MGCLVCVICNSNSIHTFIFKFCIIIVHVLKMYISYLMYIPQKSCFPVLGVLDIFLLKMFRWCLVCVFCNSNSFHSLMLIHKDCSYIEHVYLLFCAHFIIFYYFRAIELRHLSIKNA